MPSANHVDRVTPSGSWARVAIDNGEELIGLALLTIIGLVMVAQVFLRTLFGAPLSWPEELSQFLFIWCSALGAIGAAKRLGLVRLGVVADNLPPKLRAAFDYVVLLLILMLLAILGWYGWGLMSRTSFSFATLPLTWASAYAAAPVMSVLLGARLIQLQIFRYRFVFIETFLVPAGANKLTGGME
ncbi:TRAP transporter small permease subunit [Castellaniella sp. GW247-6E4]|uniref:TRAP transporter small permease n=1 Tax=Castellaniella sp. GW247-6E4 TaxID=3140380 RepID=UPI003315F191